MKLNRSFKNTNGDLPSEAAISERYPFLNIFCHFELIHDVETATMKVVDNLGKR